MKVALGNFEEINYSKWKPKHIQFDTENYAIPEYNDLVFVDRIMEEKIEGKYSVIYYDPTKSEMFYEYYDFPPTIEQEVDILKADLGSVLYDNAQKTAQIKSLEQEVGSLLLEVASLKMGGNA